jgi:hypothetical protein
VVRPASCTQCTMCLVLTVQCSMTLCLVTGPELRCTSVLELLMTVAAREGEELCHLWIESLWYQIESCLSLLFFSMF